MPRLASTLLIPSLLLFVLPACRRVEPEAGAGRAGAPSRIVSLTPSVTEILFALGAGDKVVGVSIYCDHPGEARTRPRVGSFLQPNIERILSLRPDLVVLDGVQEDVAQVLAHAGIRALPVPMSGGIEEVRKGIARIAEALGGAYPQAAEQLVAGLDREIDEVRERVARRARRRVMFVVDREVGGLRGLVAAGPGSYLDEMMGLAGGDNVFSDLPLRYAKVAVEEVIARRPEVIVDAVHVASPEGRGAVLADWRVLGAEVPAVGAGEVHLISQRAFVTPGPRLGQALHELFAKIHGGG